MSDDFRPLTPLTGGSARDFLDRRGIEHRGLSERDALHLAYVLAGVVGLSKWWRWLQVGLCVGLAYLFITYVADPVALLLSGMSWEAVQYSF